MWPSLEIKAFRFLLRKSWWRKIQSLGLKMQYGKKDSEVSQFFEENIRTVAFTTGGTLRVFMLEFLSILPNNKRLPVRKLH